jgi:Uma2 family endonuclease
MTAPPATPMTADDLLHLPDDGHVYELSRGKLICMSPSAYESSRISGEVHTEIGYFVRQHRLGDVGGAEGGFRLASDPDTVRAPDVWFVRKERALRGAAARHFFVGPPDLVVEVLSPTYRFAQVAAKVQDYMDGGVPLLWVFDPDARTVAIFRPGQRVRFVDADGVLDGEDVLPGFRLALADVFEPAASA